MREDPRIDDHLDFGDVRLRMISNCPETVRQQLPVSLTLLVEYFFRPDYELAKNRNGLLDIVVPGKRAASAQVVQDLTSLLCHFVCIFRSALDYLNYFPDSSLLDDAIPQEDVLAADAVKR